MSESEDNKSNAGEKEALTRLEAAVERLLDERAAVAGRAREAEDRIQELEGLLSKLTKGRVDPASLEQAMTRLRDQNADLKDRIQQGRIGVEKLLTRVKFLEEQR